MNKDESKAFKKNLSSRNSLRFLVSNISKNKNHMYSYISMADISNSNEDVA